MEPEEVLKYTQNQLANAPFRLKMYVQDELGAIFPQRNLYGSIEKYLSDFVSAPGAPDRWIIVPGLRGVGKTTILAQLFLSHYQDQAVGQNRILYISLDDVVRVLGSNLNDVLTAYERIIGESFERLTRPVFIFVDEAQYDPKWAAVLKSLYDRSNQIFILCSGSSAVSLQTNPDVIRRAIVKKLFPATFGEFLTIKAGQAPTTDLFNKIRVDLFYASSAREVYQKLKTYESEVLQFWSAVDRFSVDEYLKIGTLPFAIRAKDEARVYQIILSLLDKVINYDIESLGRFDASTLGAVKRLLFLLAETEAVSVQKLAGTLGASVNTVAALLEVLEQAELLIRIMPYGSNSKKVRKPSKYLFMSSALRSAFLSVAGNESLFALQRGRLLEDIVAMTLYREFVVQSRGSLQYDTAPAGADFILTIAEKNIIPIEVGAGEKQGIQVRNTMKKVGGAKYGVIICRNALTLLPDANIIKIPLDYFLLM